MSFSRGNPQSIILQQIRDVVGDDLLYALDTASPPESQPLSINALSSTKRGKVARLNRHRSLPEAEIHPKANGYELFNVIGEAKITPDVSKPFFIALPQYIKDGTIRPIKYIIRPFTSKEVNTALDTYEEGKKKLKTHFRLSYFKERF